MLEVGDELRGKGTTITLFVFTDSLEVGCQFVCAFKRHVEQLLCEYVGVANDFLIVFTV